MQLTTLTGPWAVALQWALGGLRWWALVWLGLLATVAWSQPMPHSAALAPLALSESERAWLAEHPVVRIGVDPDYAPYAFIDEKGQAAGISSEITALVAQQLGIRLELVPRLTWPQILEGARQREVDLITTANHRPEREAFLAFSKPYLVTPTVIMTRTEAARLPDAQALSGQRVALVRSYSSSRAFVAAVPGAVPVYVDTPLQGLQALSSGAASAYVGVLGINTHLASRNGLSNLRVNAVFDANNSQSYGVRKDWAPLAPLLDKALASIPPEKIQAIFSRWIPVNIDHLSSQATTLDAAAKAYLAGLPELKVGVLNSRKPYDFVLPDGRHAGVAMDVLAMVRQRTGLRTALVSYPDQATLLAAYRAGKLDLIAAVNGRQPDAPTADLSEPYFVSALGVFTRRGEVFLGDVGSLFGKRVAVLQGGFSADALLAYPQIAQVPRTSLIDAAKALLAGEADHLVAETSSALKEIDEAGLVGLAYGGPLNQHPLELHMAVHPKNAELRPLLNLALAAITPEEAAAIRQRWVGAIVQSGLNTATVIRWGAVLTLLAGLGYLAFFLHARRLRREITLRAQMAQRLAIAQAERDGAEQRFRTMVDASPNALLLVDSGGHIAQATASAATLFGYATGDLVGQSVEVLVPLAVRNQHPQQRQHFAASDSPPRAMAAGRDVVALRKDGSEVPIEIRLSMLAFPDGLYTLASIVDNTQRVEALARLRESEERFRDLFENASDLIHVLDLSNRFVFVNASWCKTLGYTQEEANQLGLKDVIAPENWAHVQSLRARGLEGQELSRVQVVLITKDQQRVEVEGGITQRVVNGKVVSSRGIFRDVTARNRHLVELAVAKQKAEAADRIKSAFLASMSHELRTPLNSVIGFTGILLKRMAGPLNDEQAFQMGKVRESAHHLLSLVNDVLDISRIEAGELRVSHEAFDLQAGIAKAMATVRPMADAKALTLALTCEAQTGPALGDARRAEQVLLNLLSNAIKFTKVGGIQVQLTSHGPSTLQVAVSDTGIGVAPEDMDTLFEPFRQIDNRLARHHEGSGLGLAISRKLAELMGGSLQAHSEPGVGSTFTFTIPRADATPRKDQPPP